MGLRLSKPGPRSGIDEWNSSTAEPNTRISSTIIEELVTAPDVSHPRANNHKRGNEGLDFLEEANSANCFVRKFRNYGVPSPELSVSVRHVGG